jgi:hypothetical protein
MAFNIDSATVNAGPWRSVKRRTHGGTSDEMPRKERRLHDAKDSGDARPVNAQIGMDYQDAGGFHIPRHVSLQYGRPAFDSDGIRILPGDEGGRCDRGKSPVIGTGRSDIIRGNGNDS